MELDCASRGAEQVGSSRSSNPGSRASHRSGEQNRWHAAQYPHHFEVSAQRIPTLELRGPCPLLADSGEKVEVLVTPAELTASIILRRRRASQRLAKLASKCDGKPPGG